MPATRLGRLPRAARPRLGELLAVPRAAGPPRRRPSVAGLRPRPDQRRGVRRSTPTGARRRIATRRHHSRPNPVTTPAMPRSASTRRSCCTRCATAASSRPTDSPRASAIFPAEILARLVADGHVRHIEKRDMYGLLPAGKERHEALLDSYAGERCAPGSPPHYETVPRAQRAVQAALHRLAAAQRLTERPRRRRLRQRLRCTARRPPRVEPAGPRCDGGRPAAPRSLRHPPRPRRRSRRQRRDRSGSPA